MKPVDSLLDEFRKREGSQKGRISGYKRTADAYFGEDEGGGGSGGSIMDGSGRPTLRSQGVGSNTAGSPNLIAPIVDDFTALRGVIPLMKTLSDGDDQDALDLAVKRSRVVRNVWDNSNMNVQQPNAAWYLSAKGDAVYMLDPLLPDDEDTLDPAGVYITVYDPSHCFPKFRNGRWAAELENIYIRWTISREQAKDEYGVDVSAEQVDLILYYSRHEKQTIVGTERAKVGNIEHGFGWVPGQWVRNKMVGNRMGQSDIKQAVDPHKEIQALMIMMLDATADTVYAPFHIKNPLEVQGDTLEIGPRSVISTTGAGDVLRVAPAPPPSFAQGLSQTMQEALYHTTGTISLRQEGNIGGSNISGRAIHSVQGPMETRLALSQGIMGYHYSRLNQKILLMYEKIPDLAANEFAISGSDKGKPYTVTFTGEEIGGLTRQDVKWDALIGSTRHERLVMALQAYAQKLVPGTYVIEQLGEDDPEAVLNQALKEAKEMQAAMQPPMPPGGPGGPGGPPAPGPPGPQPGGDPGQQQADIMAASDHGQGLAAGATPDAAGHGPVQPPPPEVQGGGGGMPGFPPQATAPTEPGFGPAPSSPNVMAMVGEAMATLPAQVQAMILGAPAIGDDGAVTIPVSDWRAKSAIRKAFATVGLPVHVTMPQGGNT